MTVGNLQAIEMANAGLDQDVALQWHLRSNHYPPVHEVFIPVAKRAIDIAVDATETEDWDLCDEILELPNGRSLSVGEVIEGLHLQAFVDARLAEEEGSSWD